MRFYSVIFFLISIAFSGCRPEGCTDPKAQNFSYEAEIDDGSCDYRGCTDENALNYDPDAREDDGSCEYLGGLHFITTRPSIKQQNVFLSLKINDGYIGSIPYVCEVQFPDCFSACAHAKFTEQPEGSYLLEYWEIRQIASSVFDTLYVGQSEVVKITGSECNVFIIE